MRLGPWVVLGEFVWAGARELAFSLRYQFSFSSFGGPVNSSAGAGSFLLDTKCSVFPFI